MAENVAADLIKPIAEEIGKSIVASLKHEINCFCCFGSNVQSFMKQVKKLEDERVEVQEKVDAALRNAKRIVPKVDTWLKAANGIQVEIAAIEDSIPKIRGCLNILSRFLLSKKVKKATEAIENLIHDNKFDSISEDAFPASMQPIPLRVVFPFQSRKQIEDDIVKVLNMQEVNIVGIGGMGGVGKTTMAEKIIHRMRTENLVDETVKVVVSQPIDMLKIQGNIAEYVGLNLTGVESLQARAQKLRVNLTRGKKILFVLDDIWKEFKLEDLGIPCESGFNGCIIILTSRDKKVLNQMGEKVFAVEPLLKDEAWSLLRETAGTCVEDLSIAKEVVEECKGLPIAIVTIGKALKDEPEQCWQDALPQLKSARPENLPEFLEDVYMPLKLSYDFLEYEGEKSLFLLCSLFPEDFLISLEELTSYSLGLGMFEVNNLKQARNRVYTIVHKLKSRSLLLDCDDNKDKVKMHDVIRDVAVFIASKEGKIDVKPLSKERYDKTCEWISIFTNSSDELQDHLIGSNFPGLRHLCIQPEAHYKTLNIDDFSFLEAMQRLNVLSLRNISFESPPQTITSLENLRTLRLVGCNLKSISLVGELSNLEILIFRKCKEIEELPIEIGRLKRLKLLNMTVCKKLQKIGVGIISELTELEELKMLRSFNGWELNKVDEEKKRNVSIREIEVLHKLTCLEIEISDINLAKEEIRLPTSLQKYKILVGEGVPKTYGERVMLLKGFSKEFRFGSWIHNLVNTGESLYLDGDGSINFDLSQVYKTVKLLDIKDCKAMEELLSYADQNGTITFSKLVTLSLKQLPSMTTLVRGVERIEFPLLEDLSIDDCKNLNTTVSSKEIGVCYDCDNQHSLHLFCQHKVKFDKLKRLQIKGYENANSMWCQKTPMHLFRSLESVTIEDCSNLKMLFSSSIVKNLEKLRDLRIKGCEHIEEIIDGNREEVEICVDDMTRNYRNSSHVMFPKLEQLYLERLSSLTVLGKQIESIEFAMLRMFWIYNCPNLSRNIVSSTRNYQNSKEAGFNLHIFCFCQKVKFNCLSTLIITRFDHLRNLWCQQTPISIFTTLTSLHINECHNIRKFFPSAVVVHLVNLRDLYIRDCKNIEQVVAEMGVKPCSEDEVNKTCLITFPKLEVLNLWELPNLVVLGKGVESMEFPRLTRLRIRDCPNLRTSVSPDQILDNADINSSFCNEKVKFCRLEQLIIYSCNSIGSLFSSSMVENLVSLQNLHIEGCSNMEKVIAGEKVIHENDYVQLFPKLENLYLGEGLPLLRMLCEWRCALQLPSLEEITIDEYESPLMEFLTPGLLNVPKLSKLTTNFKELSKEEFCGMEDLNSCLQQLILSSRKASSSAVMDQNQASKEEEITKIEEQT